MLSRLRRWIAPLLRLQLIYTLEAGLVALFFIQALRFLVAGVYGRIGGTTLVMALDPALIAPDVPGVIDPSVVNSEMLALGIMVGLPLLLLLLGRLRWTLIAAVILTAFGRALMNNPTGITSITAASLVMGGGLVYTGLVIRHRAPVLPYMFILGLAVDQMYRAVGNTLDPSWSPGYADIQAILSIIAVAMSFYTVINQGRQTPNPAARGLLTFWGGIGLGGLLFLELSLLALPNAVSGRADVDYTLFVPFVMVATLLPLVPWIRKQARSFIGLFDGSLRGWSWMLIIALLIVFGTRFQGMIAGAALILAQFTVSMIWWWVARPQAEKERNFTGIWLVGTVIVFAVLAVFDNFTYEYAAVRNLAPQFAFLNNLVTSLLRGFRGMGLAVLLLGVFLAALPMVQTQRRIPWAGGKGYQSLLALLIAGGLGIAAASAARPPLVAGVRDVDRIRIGTYNIHSGYNEFFHYDLEAIARIIQQSGANVVLLQQVEAGRMTSFGVDQALWLARRLGMDTRFFPTVEGLQGLAVLSNIEIVFDDDNLLTSMSTQTGMQRVQIRPDAGVITLYNTALSLLLESVGDRPIDEQEQDQQRQMTEVFAIIARDHPDGVLGRTVVGGTFNNVPDSPLLERMRATGFSDPFAGLPIELSATFRRTGFPRARLDYLWLRNLTALGAVVMEGDASEHRMAVIEVLITRRPDQ